VTGLAFSPDGRRLAAGTGQRGSAKVWDIGPFIGAE
jgi:WD40 repeat protein